MDRHVSCHQTNMSKHKKKKLWHVRMGTAQKDRFKNELTGSPLRILVVRVLEQCFPRLEGHSVSYQAIIIMITFKRGKAPKATRQSSIKELICSDGRPLRVFAIIPNNPPLMNTVILKKNTHIDVPRCIPHKILYNVLCCARPDTSSLSRSSNRQLRSSALSGVQPILFSLPLRPSSRIQVTEHGQRVWRKDGRRCHCIRHILNRHLSRWPLAQQ